MIKGYLNHDINISSTYVISTDIIGIIVLFYPFQFVLEEKAIKICRVKTLKIGLKYLLTQHDVNNIDIEDKAKYIARFLYYRHPYLDREEIGEFISALGSSVFNEEDHNKILNNYFEFMELNNLSFLDALTRFLNSGFFLPKEAPKIDRLLQVFAEHYTEYNPYGMTTDDILMLSYGVLLM